MFPTAPYEIVDVAGRKAIATYADPKSKARKQLELFAEFYPNHRLVLANARFATFVGPDGGIYASPFTAKGYLCHLSRVVEEPTAPGTPLERGTVYLDRDLPLQKLQVLGARDMIAVGEYDALLDWAPSAEEAVLTMYHRGKAVFESLGPRASRARAF